MPRLLPGLAPLAHRNYALYWSGQLVSMSGTWIELTATSWLLYQLTDSPLLLGLGGVFRALPIFAFALLGGTVADRVERRRLLLITQSSSVVTSLVLGALVLSGHVVFWHIYVISFLNATIAAFDAPARQSLFPTLLPRGQLHFFMWDPHPDSTRAQTELGWEPTPLEDGLRASVAALA